ncbi:MAG: hypothetical protein V3T83_14135, partial [Acidobacteriota bacterium]
MTDSGKMEDTGRRGGSVVYPALLVLAAVLFLSPALFTSRVLLPADLMTHYLPLAAQTALIPGNNPITSDVVEQAYPYRAFLRSEVAQGRLPLWNPYSQAGTPFLANSVSAVLSPLQWLALLLPPALSFEYEALVKFILAGLGMFFFCRRLGLEPRYSLVAALLYEFAGYNIFFICFTNTAVSALLGWSLYFLEAYLQTRSRRQLAGFSMVLALGYLGGQMENALLLHLACGLYALIRNWRRLMPVLLASLLGVLMAAAAIFPFADFMLESATYAERSQLSADRNPYYLDWPAWPALILPHPSGGLQQSGPGPNRFSFESLAYWGIVPFFLSILGLEAWRRQRWIAALGAVLLWGVSILLGLPGVFDLFTAFPVLRQGNHIHIAFLICGSGAVLAAAGLRQLAQKDVPNRWRWGALAAALAFVAWSWATPLTRLLDPSDSQTFFFLSQHVRFPLYPAWILGALVAVWASQRTHWLVPVTACTLLADAFLFGFFFNTRVDPQKTVDLEPPVATVMKRHPHQRLVSLGVANFPPNYGMRWGIRDLRGYEIMRVSRYVRLAREFTESPGDVHFWISPSDEQDWRLIRRSGCAFVYSPQQLDRPELEPVQTEYPFLYRIRQGSRVWIPESVTLAATPSQALQQIKALAEEVAVLENAPPDALQASAGQFSWLTDQPDLVELEVDMQGSGWLVLRDTFQEGWEASVNGQAAEIFPADFLFRGVRVPQGRSVVRFEYRPRSFTWGVAVSGLALLAWTVLVSRKA